MKKTIVSCLLFCLALGAMTAGARAAEDMQPIPSVPHLLYTPEMDGPLGYAVVISPDHKRLNLRSGESRDSEPLLQVVGGTVLPYYSAPRSEWVKVKAGNQMGYVMSAYLYLGEDMEHIAPTTQVMSVQPERGQSQLPLLELPAQSSKVLALLDAGQPVTMLGLVNDWTIIRAGGFTGYVKTKYLKLEIPAPHFLADEEKDFVFSRMLPWGVKVGGVLKDEGNHAFTAFVHVELLENTYQDEIVGFDLYINHVLHSRVPFLKQDENMVQGRVFSSELTFAHDIGAVSLVPVMARGGQMLDNIIHMNKAED
ncbi:MAG: SH3 domain-containing protein [Clostridiales bacterium]|nr:SH3 domain-containing protein [Clostridiales bacterium]